MRAILTVLVFVLMAGCINNDNNDDSEANNNMQEPNHNNKSMQKERGDIIALPLLKEITNMVTDRDSLMATGRLDTRTLVVLFNKEKGNCFVTIVTSHFYNRQMLQGFVLLDDYLIAFYNPHDVCGQNLVNLNKLEKGLVKGYEDESSDTAIHTTYEPWGRKYKIHSPDSLELVYTGYF